ncbi:MAG: hypothetical protein ACOH2H_03495 [Cypionkella sp.]
MGVLTLQCNDPGVFKHIRLPPVASYRHQIQTSLKLWQTFVLGQQTEEELKRVDTILRVRLAYHGDGGSIK